MLDKIKQRRNVKKMHQIEIQIVRQRSIIRELEIQYEQLHEKVYGNRRIPHS